MLSVWFGDCCFDICLLYCIVLSSFVLFVCSVFPDKFHVQLLHDRIMDLRNDICMYVFWLPENVGFVLLFSVIPYLLGEKKINEKTAVISSLMNQEDIYRPIILSDSCCWPSENMGFALISDSCYRSHPTAISFCSWARVHAIQFNVLQFILGFFNWVSCFEEVLVLKVVNV
jgi:hypothetical protein